MKKPKYDNDIYTTIRRNIKKYRKEKGLTAAELAEMVELSHDYIRQIESEVELFLLIILSHLKPLSMQKILMGA